MSFETFAHTADIGIRAEADTPEALFADAVRGLFVVMRGDASVGGLESVEVDVAADRADRVLVALFEEFVFLQDAEGWVFADVDSLSWTPEGAGGRIRARVMGEPFDRARHLGCLQVKAVTRHELDVTLPEPGRRGTVRVIVDI